LPKHEPGDHARPDHASNSKRSKRSLNELFKPLEPAQISLSLPAGLVADTSGVDVANFSFRRDTNESHIMSFDAVQF
jgi:hypothetical protein